jgi:hypothetical protein
MGRGLEGVKRAMFIACDSTSVGVSARARVRVGARDSADESVMIPLAMA